MTASDSIGVIFDMDGVLVDSAEPHLRSWQLLAAENGSVVAPEQFAATFGKQNRDIIPELFGYVSPVRLEALGDRKEEIYRDLVRNDPPIVPGAIDLVCELHAGGARLAVGSSGPRANIDLILAAMGVSDRVSTVVSADDVTRGKPDPQVFLMAADRLGLPPNRCVVIEDAPVGIEAAHRAGARSVAVTLHHAAATFEQAHLIVARLSDLSAKAVFELADL